MEDDELLSPAALVELIPGTSKGYWSQLRFTGRGPRFYKPSPKVVLYKRSEVLEFIESSAQTQTGQVA